MIPAKKNQSAVNDGLKNQLEMTLGIKKDEPKALSGDKGRICIRVPSETKKEWEDLFNSKGISMTQGLLYAMGHLIDDLKRNAAELSISGVTRR